MSSYSETSSGKLRFGGCRVLDLIANWASLVSQMINRDRVNSRLFVSKAALTPKACCYLSLKAAS